MTYIMSGRGDLARLNLFPRKLTHKNERRLHPCHLRQPLLANPVLVCQRPGRLVPPSLALLALTGSFPGSRRKERAAGQQHSACHVLAAGGFESDPHDSSWREDLSREPLDGLQLHGWQTIQPVSGHQASTPNRTRAAELASVFLACEHPPILQPYPSVPAIHAHCMVACTTAHRQPSGERAIPPKCFSSQYLPG